MITDLTQLFLDHAQSQLPEGGKLQLPFDDGTGLNYVDLAAVDTLTDELMMLTANIVATLINAGSERDAVLENETLRSAIWNELSSWTKQD